MFSDAGGSWLIFLTMQMLKFHFGSSCTSLFLSSAKWELDIRYIFSGAYPSGYRGYGIQWQLGPAPFEPPSAPREHSQRTSRREPTDLAV